MPRPSAAKIATHLVFGAASAGVPAANRGSAAGQAARGTSIAPGAVVRTLFEPGLPSIEGFNYQREFITRAEERGLLDVVQQLTFGVVTFRGVAAKRRVVQLGWDYQFATRRASPAEPIPDFLRPLQQRAGLFGGVSPGALEEVLITEYQPGAAIGWHRDAPPFGVVIGVSLLSACRMRLKPIGGTRNEIVVVELEPRSVYLLAGPARSDWQHMIPPAKELRYSITFRTLRL